MKPVIKERILHTSGVEEESQFGISLSRSDQASLMRLLRDGLYTDRILAVIREYSTNAWDANRMAGRGDVPIEIGLPTTFSPYFIVKDNGPGLSKDDVFKIYTQYGSSTKRNTNDAVGCLGVGSKSAFCYTTSFTITSWHNGEKCIYNAPLDEKDEGCMQLFHQETCDESLTGVEIKIPVKNDDRYAFIKKSEVFFSFFEPRPKFNIELNLQNRDDLIQFKNGYIKKIYNSYYVARECTGIVGCIPYKINLTGFADDVVLLLFKKSQFYLKFDIGEVDFVASREELKYTDKTNAAIRHKINLLNVEAGKELHEAWDNASTYLDARKKLETFKTKGLDISLFLGSKGLNHRFMYYTDERLSKEELEEQSKSKKHDLKDYQLFNVLTARTSNNQLSDDFTLVIFDTKKSYKGYKFPSDSDLVIIKPIKKNGATPEMVRKKIESHIEAQKFTGLKIKNISEFSWEKPARVTQGNKKYSCNEFVYNFSNSEKESDNWTKASFDASKNDVFLLITRFKPLHVLEGYKRLIHNDREVARLAGIEFPEIKGYKVTAGKPRKISDTTGIHYLEWRKEFYKKALKVKAFYDKVESFEWMRYTSRLWISNADAVIKCWTDAGLSKDSIIYEHLQKIKKYNSLKIHIPSWYDSRQWAKTISSMDYECAFSSWRKKLYEKYPLIEVSRFDTFFQQEGKYVKLWVDYFNFIDKQNKNEGET